MAALRKRCDSQLEKRWLDLVDTLMLRPPSDGQYLIEACSTKPDFYYREHNAAIYIDGPPHDDPDQIREDETITQRLMEMGYIVIRFHHKADWNEIFQRHPDIFGTASIRQPGEEELAVVTLCFAKPDDTPFTQADRDLCRREGDLALTSIIGTVASSSGLRLTIHFAGEGMSSYWYEAVINAVGLVAGAPTALHILGEALGPVERFTLNLATSLSLTRDWLKSAAWRLTPKSPNEDDHRRPGCFGRRDQLDRRYKRCRDCGFLTECVAIIQSH
jgi:very-short-patch-repair endonuclease